MYLYSSSLSMPSRTRCILRPDLHSNVEDEVDVNCH